MLQLCGLCTTKKVNNMLYDDTDRSRRRRLVNISCCMKTALSSLNSSRSFGIHDDNHAARTCLAHNGYTD